MPEYKKPFSTHKALARRVLVAAVPCDHDDYWYATVDAVAGKNHENEVGEVKRHGVKLLKEDAVHFFPNFDPEKYWA